MTESAPGKTTKYSAGKGKETSNLTKAGKKPLYVLLQQGDNDPYGSAQSRTQMTNRSDVRSHVSQEDESGKHGSEETGHRRHHEGGEIGFERRSTGSGTGQRCGLGSLL